MRTDYDYSLFETHTDIQLTKIYNVSRQNISLQRKNYAPHTNTLDIAFIQKTKIIDDLILKYIQSHSDNISIKEFGLLHKICVSTRSIENKNKRFQIINKNRFIRIANENKIEINFANRKYKLNEQNSDNKYNYDASKFADNIRKQGIKHKQYKKLSFKIINYLANKYLELYKEFRLLRSRGKIKVIIDFYSEIFKEIDEIVKNGFPKTSENEIIQKENLRRLVLAKSNLNVIENVDAIMLL